MFAHMPARTVICMAFISLLLLSPSAFGQGKGNGGGPPPAPADPAIAYISGSTVYAMNADGAAPTALFSSASLGYTLSWSPDIDGNAGNGYQGTVAWYHSPTGVFQLALTDVRVVAGVPKALRTRFLPIPDLLDPDFSPDLDPAQAGYQGLLAAASFEQVSIGTISVAWDGNTTDPSTVQGSTFDVLYTEPPEENLSFPTDPAWSADGRLAYVRLDFVNSRGQIRVFDNISVPQYRVLVDDDFLRPSIWPRQPDWSNAGATMVFSDNDRNVWMVDADLGTPVQLPLIGQSPTFSPDDSEIAYSAQGSPGNTFKIYKYTFATGAVTSLRSDKKLSFTNPDWRPD